MARDSKAARSLSDEQLEHLLALDRQGLSASQVARLMNEKFRLSISRNAVIGQVRRHAPADRPKRAAAAATPPKPKAARPAAPRIYKGDPTDSPLTKSLRNKAAAAEAKAAPAPKLEIGELPPVEAAKGDHPDLVQLERRRCKWPVGAVTGAGQLFCGAGVGPDGEDGLPPPYCTDHARKAYQPRPSANPRNAKELTRSLRRFI